jgi:hypothetical protein
VGDLVRLKSERIGAYQEACRLAGWTEADLYAPKLVTREDNFAPGGGTRLFFDGPPFCYASVDVKLAWNTVAERLEGLRKAGTLVESAS